MSKLGMTRARRYKAGFCEECGEIPHRPNRYTCKFCAAEKNERTRVRYTALTAVGICVKCTRKPALPDQSQCAECRDKNRERVREHFHRVKKPYIEKVLDHYGRKCACPGCSETNPIFLTIDHINNDGNVQRKKVSQHRLPRWLVENNFPDGYQLLCWNCNCGKHRNKGICPHLTKGATQCG